MTRVLNVILFLLLTFVLTTSFKKAYAQKHKLKSANKIISIKNYYPGNVPLSAIKSATKLDIKPPYKLVSATVYFSSIVGTRDVTPVFIKGNIFDNNFLRYWSRITSTTVIGIDNIKVIKGSKKSNLEGISFVVIPDTSIVVSGTDTSHGEGQSSFESNDSCDTFLYFMKSKEDLVKYIDNPYPCDSTCKEEILKAKKEVEAGVIKFLMPLSLGTFRPRQEEELRLLCKSFKIRYDYELFSCLVSSGQTNGCYSLYMDKIIAQKFGKDFKEDLLKKADSMYVETNPTVYFSDCDSLPRLISSMEIETSLSLKIDKALLGKLKKCSYNDYPQVDVGFYIDTLGNPYGFFINQYISCEKSDQQYRKELSKLAKEYVKSLGPWTPGIILGKKVRTEFDTRVHFKSKN